MDKFDRKSLIFNPYVNLSSPVDRIPSGKSRLAINCRRYGVDKGQGRQGLTSESNQPDSNPVHSIYSLNDPIPSPSRYPGAFNQHARFLGIGTVLYEATDSNDPVFFNSLATGFSGSPMTFVNSGSQFSPRPWTFVGDFDKNIKANSATQSFQWGISPPNFAPTISIPTPGDNADGPDIGATGVPYVYMFRARADNEVNTGAVSNWGPPVRTVNGLSPSSVTASPAPSNILITLPQAHPDNAATGGQVTNIDVARYGGSLTTWKIIGSIGNVAGNTMLDSFNDLAIAGNLDAEFDDNQPFLSNHISIQGTGTITPSGTGLGSVFVRTADDQFLPYDATGSNPYYTAGNVINIDGAQYTFYASPTDANTVELVEDAPAGASGLFTMSTPEMARTPVPCVWGPFGGGLTGSFIFGCGDANRPGSVYWTKGNHPESHPGRNILDITSASEPLMNGEIYNGTPFVFSTQRMFSLYPSFGGTSDFVALEVPNSKGMYGRWAKCVTPWGICFGSKDGVYLTGGGTPICLTDEDLYPVFPHESWGNDDSAYPAIDGLDDLSDFNKQSLYPDMRVPDSMFLCYGDGFLYFTYQSFNGEYRTWVGQFDEATGKFLGWTLDAYTPTVTRQYFEVVHDQDTQAFTRRQTLCGTSDGQLARIGGDNDLGNAITGQLRTASEDTGDPRPRKFWADGEIDLDSQCDQLTIKWGFDNYTFFTNTSTTSLNLTGRHRAIMDINTGKGQYGVNAGLDITWTVSSGQIYLYLWTPTWQQKPELSALRVTTWDDLGYPGAKFIQGFKLRADTLNVARTVQVLDDTNTSHSFTPTTVVHNGEQTIAYSFNTPFISHLVRFWPQDAAFWRIEGVEWVFEPAPELVTTWTSQQTTFDLDGWLYHRDSYLPVISTAAVTLTVNAVGNPLSPFTYAVASTSGLYDKIYKSLQAMKCRAASYSLTADDGTTGFRVYQKDLQINVKQWGSNGRFLPKQPIGDLSRINGARI